jgi:hypothetical protein
MSGPDWYAVQGLRTVNQSIGRVIRHKDDFGAILLFDERYEQARTKALISEWVRKELQYRDSFGALHSEMAKFFNKNSGMMQFKQELALAQKQQTGTGYYSDDGVERSNGFPTPHSRGAPTPEAEPSFMPDEYDPMMSQEVPSSFMSGLQVFKSRKKPGEQGSTAPVRTAGFSRDPPGFGSQGTEERQQQQQPPAELSRSQSDFRVYPRKPPTQASQSQVQTPQPQRQASFFTLDNFIKAGRERDQRRTPTNGLIHHAFTEASILDRARLARNLEEQSELLSLRVAVATPPARQPPSVQPTPPSARSEGQRTEDFFALGNERGFTSGANRTIPEVNENTSGYSNSMSNGFQMKRAVTAPAEAIETKEDAVTCVICYEKKSNILVSRCGHVGCEECWTHWLAIKQQCPVCKKETKKKRLTRLHLAA